MKEVFYNYNIYNYKGYNIGNAYIYIKLFNSLNIIYKIEEYFGNYNRMDYQLFYIIIYIYKNLFYL